MLLQDKVAIVTGGAKGMGCGIALKFASEGCSVAVVDIDIVEADNTVAAIRKEGGLAMAIQCDVTDEKQVHAAVDLVVKKYGKVDILVNNAGGAHITARIEDLTEEQWDKVMDLNLKSHFLFCKYVVPLMKARKYGKLIGLPARASPIIPPSQLSWAFPRTWPPLWRRWVLMSLPLSPALYRRISMMPLPVR